MGKTFHEIRDPIHVFVRLDSDERKVLNSRPFQRLRHVHQLALSYLVYPGATHKRFEHSLGVMELASRVFDVVTAPENLTDKAKDLFPDATREDQKRYWRRVLRMAALCHDIGHLPFSHAAEHRLLPAGVDHERLTRDAITGDYMNSIWGSLIPPLNPEHVVKIALGPKKTSDLSWTLWETVLSEIITGNAFGVDRMDYLLRDSYHIGVAYGRFDHPRLIDTLRILVPVEDNGSTEPALGIEAGGIESAEALLLARYFMFSQVYLHRVRRIYDIHLCDFLVSWLRNGRFGGEYCNLIEITDNEVNSALFRAAFAPDMPGHEAARRIVCREHYKEVYSRNPEDFIVNPESGTALAAALLAEFGPRAVIHDSYPGKAQGHDFPVEMRDGRVLPASLVSATVKDSKGVALDTVYADPSKEVEIRKWLTPAKRREIIKPVEEQK